ncbi:MAG: 2-hydroxychromene-2-carboxylate isomerase [Sneathiellaceae bacterium]
MHKLEFFYDLSSPWTYLATSRIGKLAADAGAELAWKPILVGGVFNAVNQQVYETRAAPDHPKYRHMGKDLADCARYYGLAIRFRPTVFPVNSAAAMRGAFLAEERGLIHRYNMIVGDIYWGRDRDISQDEVLAEIAGEAGIEPAEFLAAVRDPALKARLKDNTQELIDRGGFGSPTIFVDGEDMYFGNDRLFLVEDALRR